MNIEEMLSKIVFLFVFSDEEEISFFPSKSKSLKKEKNHELTDTFSLQEVGLDSDIDSDRSGSPSLELLLPDSKDGFLERFKELLCFPCNR